MGAVSAQTVPSTEVIVTAEKRDQRAADIPISINVVTANAGIASVEHGGLTYNADSFANFPLMSGVLALRLGAGYRFDAGYVDNVANGEVQVWPRGATAPPAAYQPVTYPS